MTHDLSALRLIGMIHLPALPGSPGFAGSREDVLAYALRDAEALADADFDALLLENFGDVPFAKTEVGPEVIAEMCVIAYQLQCQYGLPLGVQVLRNDARASLAIAAAVGAAFIRVNVHTGAMLTDQGIIEGRAHETLRYRQTIGAGDVAILADVHVKHAVPLAGEAFEDALADTVHRGLADAIIVSGKGTGRKTDAQRLRTAAAISPVPVYVGSGADADSLSDFFPAAHGVIVGSSIKQEGISSAPVDPEKALRFAEAFRAIPFTPPAIS
ncbi:MAG: BtpA/SgcQ family protein [Bacteroidia bacterium]|nr:BtpA/SgcQ family protein [Bacteroidia bacterium]